MGRIGSMYADNDNWRPQVFKAVLVEIQVFGDVGSCVLVKLRTSRRGAAPQNYQRLYISRHGMTSRKTWIFKMTAASKIVICKPEGTNSPCRSSLARSQYSEGPATGHLDTGFPWFPCVYRQMLRWFQRFQVATTCFSCSPPELNLLVTNFIFCIHVK